MTNNAWKAQKRAEREAAWAHEYQIRRIEEDRKDALSMYERIQESDASSDVKEILHMLAEKVGLE